MQAASLLKLEVTTAKGVVLSVEAASVTAPSVSGEFGVLPGHLPILAAIRPGLLTYRVGQEEKKAAVRDGFVEADASRVQVLTRGFAQKSDLQGTDVQAQLKKAEAAMQAYTGEVDTPEFKKLEIDLLWARACAAVEVA